MTLEQDYMKLLPTTRIMYKQDAILRLNETYECGVLQEIKDEDGDRRFRPSLCTASQWLPIYLGEEQKLGLVCARCGEYHEIHVPVEDAYDVFAARGVSGVWDASMPPLLNITNAEFRTVMDPVTLDHRLIFNACLLGQWFKGECLLSDLRLKSMMNYSAAIDPEREVKVRVGEEMTKFLFDKWFGASESPKWVFTTALEMEQNGLPNLPIHPQVRNFWDRFESWRKHCESIVAQVSKFHP